VTCGRTTATTTTKLYFTPELEEKKNLQRYTKAKMIEVLAKNARQPVKRKDILHEDVYDRDPFQLF